MTRISFIRSITQGGFTLVELVAILVLVGVLAFTAIPRFQDNSVVGVSVAANQLANDIRYAQSLSMTQGARYCIYLNTAIASYQLRNTNCTTAVTHPVTGSTGYISLANVSMAAANISGNYIEFDGKGKPYTFTVATSNGVITLTESGQSKQITVSPETGRVAIP